MILQGNIPEKCEKLRKDGTFKQLFSILESYDDTIFSIHEEKGEEIDVTYAEMARQARRYAAFFTDAFKGSPVNSFIAISADTCPDWLYLFWGVIMSGHRALLLDFSLSDEMTTYMMEQAGATGIVASRARKLPATIKAVTLSDVRASKPAGESFTPVFGDAVALCTSGTTETSRIFVYDQKAICAQCLTSELIYKENKRIIDDKNYHTMAFLPFHHVLGFVVVGLWCTFCGYTTIYIPDRSPQTVVKFSNKYKLNILIAVPVLANNLSNGVHKKLRRLRVHERAVMESRMRISLIRQQRDAESGIASAKKMFAKVLPALLGPDVNVIILGGSHTPVEHMRTLSALGYYTVMGFGMTETAVSSVEMSMDLKTRLSGSVGRPLTNTEYKVLPDGDDASRGEMIVKAATMHTGRMVGGELLPLQLDEGGYFHTGDVVRLGDGMRMFVEGRIKDVIINESGENVYPDEIEDAFSGLKGAEQLCVLGLPKNKGKYEDIALVINVGTHFSDEEALSELTDEISKINKTLPVLKRLSRIVVTNEPLPLVNGIKVKRVELRKRIERGDGMYRDLSEHTDKAGRKWHSFHFFGTNSKPKEPSKDDKLAQLREKVRQIYADALSVKSGTIRDDAHFIDELGGDSLQVLSMSLKIEEELGVTIPPEEYGDCTTVNGLAELIYKKLYAAEAEPQVKYEKEKAEPVEQISRFEDTPEYKAFEKRYEKMMAEGSENPYFVCHESPLTDTSVMAGERVVNFGSYNYVGMSGRREVSEAAKAAIDKYGTSASGSRLLAGEKKVHEELEKAIAEWKHAEDALVLNAGHATNVTVVGNFCGKGDLIVYDAIAHNSIAEGCRLSSAVSRPFPHDDPDALEIILKSQRKNFAKVLIVIEGAYSMDGDIANVPAFVALKKKYGCFLMVDEAHSACVIGQNGGGVDEYFHLASDDVDIKMGTLSKGLGTCGGYVAGKRSLIEYMRYSIPGFVFSVGIPPAMAAASLRAIQLLKEDPSVMENMRRNISVFMEEARKHGFNTCLAGQTAIVPVLVGKDEDAFLLSNMMRHKGVFVPPAVPPAVPRGKSRLRFCVTSDHKPEQIADALNKLEECAKEAGIVLPS